MVKKATLVGCTLIVAAFSSLSGASKAIAPVDQAQMTRQGNMLFAVSIDDSINLCDLNGNVMQTSDAVLPLKGLRPGMYIAQSGNKTLKVDVK